ncbi:serine/threonine-protein kinase mos isoform X2 [Harpegnathos saltator]|uniref:non-specific serine/threonine protein kinase n=1 Tax=Harpegnathos saltator TaxID=610380 RepID=E2C056_HARSA|nr:serine/threonine-protein kinase mos isoform X2 [Harpegnathos saltator]EFN78666.1 Probable LIM domain-containing serine/threonine-protein kinase [Harpegnathos saltator]
MVAQQQMASPRIVSTFKRLSPRSFDNVLDVSPKTPRNLARRPGNEKLLSPFNIDTPNRMKILKEGLPKKQYPVLGAGAFGTVYKAFYKGDQVAAKVIQHRQNDDELINSEKHAAILRHANIVKILNVEQGSSLSLITMELCGTSLQDKLQETVLPRQERVSIWRDIAHALRFCHNSGVIHADVKPTNILMAADGRPKLTDFGSSLLLDELHISIKPRGTPGYAAPEMLRGNAPTFTADIYSLGIVAWQMLSRQVPFHGLHIHTIIYISAKGTRPNDEALDDEFNGGYKKLYRATWSQNAAERPKLGEIINRLDLLLHC